MSVRFVFVFFVSVLRKEKAGAQVCFLFSEDVWWCMCLYSGILVEMFSSPNERIPFCV